nr:hypothetical protein Hi04_10k_c5202_00012 [uncultured bacterium]
MRRAGLFLLACALPACTCGDISSDRLFQRMELQQKYQPYEENDMFADGRAMRPPPEGTVPRERTRPGDRAFQTGMLNNEFVSKLPVHVNRELMTLGKKRYEIVCANCHGVLGDGRSVVADNMGSRIPPDLHHFRDQPDGFFFAAITQGYGYMPSFAGEIPVEERWAVVAYVRALQKARSARYADLTDAEKRKVGPPVRGSTETSETAPLEAPSPEERP